MHLLQSFLAYLERLLAPLGLQKLLVFGQNYPVLIFQLAELVEGALQDFAGLVVLGLVLLGQLLLEEGLQLAGEVVVDFELEVFSHGVGQIPEGAVHGGGHPGGALGGVLHSLLLGENIEDALARGVEAGLALVVPVSHGRDLGYL